MKRTITRKLLAIMFLSILVLPMMTVQPAQAASLPVRSGFTRSALQKITLSKTSVSITTKQTHQLRVTFTPASAAAPVVWSSSNNLVASVDRNGVISPKMVGSCTVTAQCQGKRASCKVTVKAPKDVAVKSISVRASSVTLEVGDTWSVQAKIFPTNATNKKLSYTTSSSKVCKVSSSGRIEARAAGKATVTVKSGNGKYAKISVTVNQPRMYFSSNSLHLSVGDTSNVKSMLTVKGMKASDVRFSSSNTKIVTIDRKTGALKAVGDGEATIKATCGNKTVTLKVSVERTRVVNKSYTYTGNGKITDTFDIVLDTKTGDIDSVTITNTVHQSTFKHVRNVVITKSDSRWVIRTEYIYTTGKNYSEQHQYSVNADVSGKVGIGTKSGQSSASGEIGASIGTEYSESNSSATSWDVHTTLSMLYYIYDDGTVTRVIE